MKKFIVCLSIIILLLPITASANKLRVGVTQQSSISESIDYSITAEIPKLTLSYHWDHVYLFGSYARNELVYGGQKSHISEEYGVGVGFETKLSEKALVFFDVGYYFIGYERLHSFDESVQCLFRKEYGEWPHFEKYDMEIEPALGLTLGMRYYLTKRLSMAGSLHYRSHDANIYGRGLGGDDSIYWTMKYKENHNMIGLQLAWDF